MNYDDAIERLLDNVWQQMQRMKRGDTTLVVAAAELGMMPFEFEAIYRAHFLNRHRDFDSSKRPPTKAL